MPPADLLTDVADDGSLVAGLSSDDAHVRLLAARALGRLHDPPEASDALLERARIEQDPDVLVEEVFALGQRKHVAAGPWLASLLDLVTGNPSPAVRAGACDALGRLGDDGPTDLLILRLQDNDAGVRGAAALALFALDGRRYTHERHATEAQLAKRDAALTEVALHDPDNGARWRATYALAGVRGRRGLATALALAVPDTDPLVRLFALRGLVALQREDLGVALDLRPFFSDPDERVVVEAVQTAAVLGEAADVVPALSKLLRSHDSGIVRTCAADSLSKRVHEGGLPADVQRTAADLLATVVKDDPSPMVRRAAASAVVLSGDEGRALFCLHTLARSNDRRDRERAATLLAEGPWRELDTLQALRADDAPSVAAAALQTMLAKKPQGAPLYGLSKDALVETLVAALADADPALRTTAAEAILPEAQEGTADPRLLHACAVSLLSANGPEMKEAAQALRKALGLPPDSAPPGGAHGAGRLLDRLLAQDEAARKDPRPKLRLTTTRGSIELELDRVTAPVHVANFLELLDKGCYDGLDFHRVVPDFVVQGLDPRGDGYGTGGRRVPDEFSNEPFLTGALGMPNAGEPNTGGCQIFFTHLPTPHLDGHYTVFGRVVTGIDVVERLEIGDRVTKAARE
ncbi:MAG TPA: peptidylprolyl isomerase [Planctomycetota bacterium]|nr:peptidylprolyl isomerase [Planctomycetota bacterium]